MFRALDDLVCVDILFSYECKNATMLTMKTHSMGD